MVGSKPPWIFDVQRVTSLRRMNVAASRLGGGACWVFPIFAQLVEKMRNDSWGAHSAVRMNSKCSSPVVEAYRIWGWRDVLTLFDVAALSRNVSDGNLDPMVDGWKTLSGLPWHPFSKLVLTDDLVRSSF